MCASKRQLVVRTKRLGSLLRTELCAQNTLRPPWHHPQSHPQRTLPWGRWRWTKKCLKIYFVSIGRNQKILSMPRKKFLIIKYARCSPHGITVPPSTPPPMGKAVLDQIDPKNTQNWLLIYIGFNQKAWLCSKKFPKIKYIRCGPTASQSHP